MSLKRPLIFFHYPWTGGLTLSTILRRNLSSLTWGTIAAPGKKRERQFPSEEFRRLNPSTNPFAVITGHMPFGLHEQFGRPCDYITLFRDPVKRAISEFYFYRAAPEDYHGRNFHRDAHGFSLEKYAESGLNAVSNFYTKSLSTTKEIGSYFSDPLPDNAFALAKKNLDERFKFIGITERFDETLVLLQKTLKLRSIYYSNLGVNRSRPDYSHIPQSVWKKIEAKNALDLELCEYARGIFEDQIKQYGPSFGKDVEKFKKMNSFLTNMGVTQTLMRNGRKKRLKMLVKFWLDKARAALPFSR